MNTRFWLKRFVVRVQQINSWNRLRVFLCDALNIVNARLHSRFLQKISTRGLEKAALFAEKKLRPWFDGEKYNFNGIYLPYKKENSLQLWDVVQDVFSAHLYNQDNYDASYVDKLDKHLPEGVYCYSDANAKILISKGDVVLDLGAWIGDFSAYAAYKGATVYAFEPFAVNRVELEKTIAYNKERRGEERRGEERRGEERRGEREGGSISIEPYGVGEKTDNKCFSAEGNSAGLGFSKGDDNSGEAVQIVALDDWVQQKNIKVNFIKSDIEGYERHMLRGARNILKTHQPILSLCTYHFPDDPQVLRDIILDANPAYRIIQRRMKLFAYVP